MPSIPPSSQSCYINLVEGGYRPLSSVLSHLTEYVDTHIVPLTQIYLKRFLFFCKRGGGPTTYGGHNTPLQTLRRTQEVRTPLPTPGLA